MVQENQQFRLNAESQFLMPLDIFKATAKEIIDQGSFVLVQFDAL